MPTRTPTEPADGSSTPVAGPNTRVELPLDTRTRFRDGDIAALGEVYDRYARPVWSVAIGVVRVDHLAQEAVQEAFLRAWTAASTYDPDRDLGSWLFAIARFAALDLLRRELRPTRGGHEEMPDAAADTTGVEPPGLDTAWVSWTVQEALRQLADHEREIVRLSFYEDLTHAQIAERLDLPIGTVKSRSHRAHRRLADLLAHLRDDPATEGPATDGAGNRPAAATRTPDKAPATGKGNRR